tara:strand:+ start:342 stop:596 length:255 start_codon:yes stop_codon:yes gene_type:complete
MCSSDSDALLADEYFLYLQEEIQDRTGLDLTPVNQGGSVYLTLSTPDGTLVAGSEATGDIITDIDSLRDSWFHIMRTSTPAGWN